MKNYIIILCILLIGCKNEPNNNQKQLMNKTSIEGADLINIDTNNSIIYWTGNKIYKSHNGTLKFFSGNICLNSAACSLLSTHTVLGWNSLICLASFSIDFRHDNASILNLSGNSLTTSSVFNPIEPVDPRRVIFFIRNNNIFR